MNVSSNIIYIDNFSIDNDSRVVGQTIVPCNRIGNSSITIPIEGLNDSLEQIQPLKENIEQLKKEKETMLSRISTLESEYQDAHTQVVYLESQIDYYQGVVSNHLEQINSKDTTISELQKTNSELVQENADLVEANSELVQENADLVEANLNLQEEIPESGRELYRVDLTVNGEVYSIITRPVYSLHDLELVYPADKCGIFIWELKHEEEGIYWYELSYKTIINIDEIEETFETTFNRDGYVLLCVDDGSFFSDTDMILTKIRLQTPIADTFAIEIGNLNVKLNEGADNLISTSSLKFNDPESDGPLVPIVGW